jgi:hypothetical protein
MERPNPTLAPTLTLTLTPSLTLPRRPVMERLRDAGRAAVLDATAPREQARARGADPRPSLILSPANFPSEQDGGGGTQTLTLCNLERAGSAGGARCARCGGWCGGWCDGWRDCLFTSSLDARDVVTARYG